MSRVGHRQLLLLFFFFASLLTNGLARRTVTSYAHEPDYTRAYYGSSRVHDEPNGGNHYDHEHEHELQPPMSEVQCPHASKPKCESQYPHLESCVQCEMRAADSSRYQKCHHHFHQSMYNATLHALNDPAMVVCCHVSRFMRCTMPLIFRSCDQCALQQFVKKFRPHLELCHLVTSIQCPVADGRFVDDVID